MASGWNRAAQAIVRRASARFAYFAT